MKRHWTIDELVDHWTLVPNEVAVLANKSGATRLGFAVLLKYFQLEGRFPAHPRDVPAPSIVYVAKQVGVPPEAYLQYRPQGRTIEYHRAQIRETLGFRTATEADGMRIVTWLVAEIVPHEQEMDRLAEAVYTQCRMWQIEPPAAKQIERLVHSALHTYEVTFCAHLAEKLSPATRTALDTLLDTADERAPATNAEASASAHARLHDLNADPGRLSVETAQGEIDKLLQLRALDLPNDLFATVPPKTLHRYRQRVGAESPYELRRHPDAIRATLLAAWAHERIGEVTDTLVDLLIDMIHLLSTRAEHKVDKRILDEVKHVTGKHSLLFHVAEASLQDPDGRVRDVIFPIVNEQTLHALVKEWKATGPTYRHQVQTVMRNAYRWHYRQAVPLLVRTLTFQSNNRVHRPVIAALELLLAYADSKQALYPSDVEVPLAGVVRPNWQPLVMEPSPDGPPRVNRINYELCVLQAVREKLRCRELWVVGARRHQNPDADVPQDFDHARQAYYAALHLPEDADTFVRTLKQELTDELTALDQAMPTNRYCRILDKKGTGWISLTPLTAQPEPQHLSALKAEVGGRWAMTPLLDMLKETDLRVGFTDVFTSPTGREHLERDVLQRRLLLCLFGLGTNTGLKRISATGQGDAYKDLLYVRRRFLTIAQLRAAIARVVNATFAARMPQIWGEGTTACASDSKKFGAWDQNLMSEWSIRHRGPGIMIYWHVEKKATCIYSQLKTVSSSEVAAMIEGVQRHCTDMEIDRQYVDSHGQSEVAFGFCRLLNFDLLPRLKAIPRQRLYRPEGGAPEAFPNLQRVLTRPIDWDLIRQQYDEMVKYATALRLGTAEADAILRRFTRSNGQHPTYRALIEVGKAQKTKFLCRYLRSEPLRREIQEGLNVIETWNSVTTFIFYGKGGEFATNQREDQERAMLCLHLLQISMGYINTLMIQHVLQEPAWANRLGPADYRALTPLIHTHVNPYGRFDLDLTTRLAFDAMAA